MAPPGPKTANALNGPRIRCPNPRRLASPRDLLILVATFSVLTIYVTFQIGPTTIRMPSYVDQNVVSQLSLTSPRNDPENWLLLLCMTFNDRDSGLCMDRKELTLLQRYQRVNRLPGLYDILCKKDSLCSVMNEAKKIPGFEGDKWFPLCYLLPSQHDNFARRAISMGDEVQWLLKPHNARVGYSEPRPLDLSTPLGHEELNRYRNKKAIVQQMVGNPLTIFNRSVNVRFYVLVTSLAPLRAYLHSSGILYHRYDQTKSFRKIPGRAWPLSQFWRYLIRIYGDQAVKDVSLRLDQMLVHTLLLAEALLLAKAPFLAVEDRMFAKTRCPHCFQLLGIDVVFNSTLWPSIVDINGQPNLRLSVKEGNVKANSVKRSVVEDMIALIFTPNKVADKIASNLENVSANFGILGINCQTNHNLCLSVEDLEYLMQSQREQQSSGGFRQIFPGPEPNIHGSIAEDINHWVKTAVEPEDKWVSSSNSASRDIVSIVSVLKKHSSDPSDVTVKSLNASTPLANTLNWRFSSANLTTNGNKASAKGREPDNVAGYPIGAIECSKDQTTMPYLSSIVLYPKLDLVPRFSPLVSEYSATVPHDLLLVRVGAIAENCQTEVRIDDKYGPAGFTNFTLGVGDNRIIFHVVDVSHKTPWIVNTYTLVVRRQAITYGEEPFDPTEPHQVCSLSQECEMQMSQQEPCGIQRDISRLADWRIFISETMDLPYCTTGDALGRWVLPCLNCRDRTTCYWREAIWHPFDCKHPVLSKDSLARCLAHRKLLFIGDSTNRGMMEYIMERLNGTLTEWDKTHDIRVYGNLNNHRTSVSFAYYPQFWLPTKERPVFEKAVYQLIQKSRPVANNTNTVLVVGGVHWLATQHLLMLLKALKVERLQGIRLFVKSLGSGFHQMVEGLRSLSLEEQRKLLFHNRDLIYFAKHYNFEVIDTFNMTVARYKDFLQGKCACHFHKVVETQVPNLNGQWHGRTHRKQPRYHVEGAVNAIYSEILLGRICNDYVTRR